MKKIMIIGPSGAGKTTLAQQLAKRLNLPVYHLDTFFWAENWKQANYEQFIQKQYEIVDQDRWVIDGNFRHTLSIRLVEADTVIFLDIGRWRCLYRVIKRNLIYYGRTRSDFPAGCVARFDKKFFLFLRDIWQWKAQCHHHIMDYLSISNWAQVHHLKSQKDVDVFLADLQKKSP
jgi:adenylate kinase family enzyme